MTDADADIDPEVAALLAAVADDFRARIAVGENPNPEDYALRHPTAASEIRGVLSLLRMGALSRQSSTGQGQTVDQVGTGADTNDADYAANQAPALKPGDVIGGFEMQSELGRGGMGAVYRALDRELKREVAIKVMLPAVSARAKNRERFLREARALAAIHHDHVVPVFQVGEERGVPFLVMPLLGGETLEARLRREGALSPMEVVRIGRETALGLAALHAKGLIHRDLKPANLWLEVPAGRVKLLDLGLARDPGGDDQVTARGTIVGTPAYMSPEQVNGEELDARSDLFSLGSVLYEAATGRQPFAGKSLTAVLASVGESTPTPVSAVNAAIPVALSDLLENLHRKRAADRPGSAALIADELERIGHQEPRASARSPQSGWLNSKSKRWTVAATIALALICLAIFVAGGFNRPDPNSNQDGRPETTKANLGPGGEAAVAPMVLEPLRVRDLSVLHWEPAAGKDRERGVLGKDSFSATFGGAIEISAHLTRPAYAFVIVFRPDGKDEVLYPQDDTDVPERTDQPSYPSKRRTVRYGLTDGTGLWLVTLVSSDSPLPSYRDWRMTHTGSPWAKADGKREVVWLDDGRWLEELAPGRPAVRGARGEVEVADKAPVVRVVDWLKTEVPGAAVSAVAFTVMENK